MPKKMTEWQEMLLKAADYIEKFGWTRNILIDKKGRVCVLGAIEAVYAKKYQHIGCKDRFAVNYFLDFLHKKYPPSRWPSNISIPYWNDYIVKNKREVVQALRACAKKEN